MSRHTRNIRQRWIIRGSLELLSPTHLSNGDAAFDVDMPLVQDPLTGRPLLTGASLGGALRNYTNEYFDNYTEENGDLIEPTQTRVAALFGGTRQNEEGAQSTLIIEDALGTSPASGIELRDGVRIDSKTRTAYIDEQGRGSKFDLQLLAAGTKFDIGFEVIITQEIIKDKKVEEIRETLAVALAGLQDGHIFLGGRKSRGYGECRVTQWSVREFDLTQADDLVTWLGYGRFITEESLYPANIAELLLPDTSLPKNQRDIWTIHAEMAIDGSMLIRSGFETDEGPDMSHLESYRHGKLTPIISGTSLAGVMRFQALRITHTISQNEAIAHTFIDNLFGHVSEDDKTAKASRVLVQETAVEGARKLVQSRVAIDRFTGGALESALFTEQPIFGGTTNLTFSIKNPSQAEIGLLLLVLKDLWTGFMPVGGEASVGRGRLRGLQGTITHRRKRWTLTQGSKQFITAEHGATITELQDCVAVFHREITNNGGGQ